MRSFGRWAFLGAIVAALLAATVDASANAVKMYWTDGDSLNIQRANPDGSGVEIVVTDLVDTRGIALDAAGGKMYWIEHFAQKIQRANLDGSAMEDLVTTGMISPIGLAIDVADGKMYWADASTCLIQSANLEIPFGETPSTRTDVEDLVTGPIPPDVDDHAGTNCPAGLALDLAGGKMYWTEGVAHRIQRANLDGSDIEALVQLSHDLNAAPIGIALDVAGGKMYWTDRSTGKIQRANLNGSSVEDLVTGLSIPLGIALDVDDGKMYWVDNGVGNVDFPDQIQRANLEIPVGETPSTRTDVEDLVTGLINPFFIALLFEIVVDIDIKPGSDPNSINLDSAGVVSVAIFSSESFDATMDLDPDSISLASARVKMVGKSGRLLCHEEFVNEDDLLDLVCQVETAQFIIEEGESIAVLEAATFDGIPVRGEDDIRIVP